MPQSWPIRVTGFSLDGELRVGNPILTDVAGPCCFAADLIAKETVLPKLEQDDYVMVHDTGAYYFSNHLDYNSLPKVAVYSARNQDNELKLNCIRKAESLDNLVANMSL